MHGHVPIFNDRRDKEGNTVNGSVYRCSCKGLARAVGICRPGMEDQRGLCRYQLRERAGMVSQPPPPDGRPARAGATALGKLFIAGSHTVVNHQIYNQLKKQTKKIKIEVGSLPVLLLLLLTGSELSSQSARNNPSMSKPGEMISIPA